MRDADVLVLLGLVRTVRGRLQPDPRYTADWITYRWLMLDSTIRAGIDDDAALDAQVSDVPRLRLLDTVLWMAATADVARV